jgi:hypothetical protein
VRGLLKAQEFDRAEREVRALIEQAPHVAAVHVQNGVLAASRNDVTSAKALRSRLAIDRDSMEAFAGLLALDLNHKDFSAAKVRLDRRSRVRPRPLQRCCCRPAEPTHAVNDLPASERSVTRH